MRVSPPRGRCTTARNKYEKSIIAAAGKFLSLFFAYVFCISCFCVLLCVAVRGCPCCLCNGAVVSSRLLHMRLFQPHIYNMTNLSKNKNRFFKGAGLRPSASGERHEIIFSPSFGLIYNMLKNSKSVTLFVIFFQKKRPGFHRGNRQRKPQL